MFNSKSCKFEVDFSSLEKLEPGKISILRWNAEVDFSHIFTNINVQISIFYRVIFKEVDSCWKIENSPFTFASC